MYTEPTDTLADERPNVNMSEHNCSQKNEMTRKYELKLRATRQEATRQRIVEAAVELHEKLGPARTSISAIAERAGVERLTVYRHFATEEEIFQACSAHFNALHPFPDFPAWEAIDEPFARLALGLTELYRYFAETERMLSAVIRDTPSTPAMHEPVAHLQQELHAMFDLLVTGFAMSGIAAERVQLPIRLATDFQTWQIMVGEQGINTAEAVDYQLQVVHCAVDRS